MSSTAKLSAVCGWVFAYLFLFSFVFFTNISYVKNAMFVTLKLLQKLRSNSWNSFGWGKEQYRRVGPQWVRRGGWRILSSLFLLVVDEGFLSQWQRPAMGWRLCLQGCTHGACALFFLLNSTLEKYLVRCGLLGEVICLVRPTDTPGEGNKVKKTSFWTHSPPLVTS